MDTLLSCFSTFSRQKRKDRKAIEEKAKNIENQASWTCPRENVCMLEAFEWYTPPDGRHYQRLQSALPDLKDIGIDNLLLPPGCKAMQPSGNGYDIYDLYDLGEFDQKGSVATKWGSKQELLRLAQTAEGLEMGIYWDAVLNHKAGADRKEKCLAVTVDPKDRNIDLTKPHEIEAWVGFDFASRGGTYSKLKYGWQHFNGTDFDDCDKSKTAIYKIFAPGKDWAKDVSIRENGNYDYLMFANLDHSDPEVREDILNWAEWIGGQLPLKGMRLDAVKHYSAGFQRVLVDHIQQIQKRNGGKEWFFVSEYWSGDASEIQEYLKTVDYKMHAFDAPLCQRLSAVSQTIGADLRLVFDKTLAKLEPEHAVTFVMNHDTQPHQALEVPISDSFKPLAYALVLLRKDGYPCVFYGDLYGICSQNVNAQRFRHPHVPKELRTIPAMILARKLYAYGEQQDYFLHRNCIGFVRYGNAKHPWGMACAINNGSKPMKLRMFVGKSHAGETWSDVLDTAQVSGEVDLSLRNESKTGKVQKTKRTVRINSKGYADFPVERMSVSVWVNEAAEGQESFGASFNSNIYAY